MFEDDSREVVTVRRYDDPVEVRRTTPEREASGAGVPAQFLWRGRVWKVNAVLAHWVETGAWWAVDDEPAAGLPPAAPDDLCAATPAEAPVDLMAERELWRVEAGRGRDTGGVFDLALDRAEGLWQLVGCAD